MPRMTSSFLVPVIVLLGFHLVSPGSPGQVSESAPATLDCADPASLDEIPARVQHRSGDELHQAWTLVDQPSLWQPPERTPAVLVAYRARVRELFADISALGLLRENRRLYPWLEAEHPIEREINRRLGEGQLGRLRPLTCLEEALLAHQAARADLLDRPSEIAAAVLRRSDPDDPRVRVYTVADLDDSPPPARWAMQGIERDVADGWVLEVLFHNHTFELGEERGHLAIAAPSASDLQLFTALRKSFGLRWVLVSDGFSTLELTGEEIEQLARDLKSLGLVESGDSDPGASDDASGPGSP